ncbi:nuclear transport factor 2 family protein [Ureibacillus sp. FSL K6-8385]|uniref:nuclear transport factor 2 family protein n=1 Tax=Ureibacillus sp. FSL K6-8385 TaxID=2954684 RepID=UPI0031584B01
MKKWLMFAVAAVFLLSACGNTKSESNGTSEEAYNATANHEKSNGQPEDSVGFEMIGEAFVEAENVPAAEKAKIMTAFNEYIDAFNDKDIGRYGKVLSKNASGFNYDEEIEVVKETFKNHDVKLVDSDATIVKYSDDEAQVVANIDYHVKEHGTDATLNRTVRQVTIFVKEDGDWKITRIVGMEKLDE